MLRAAQEAAIEQQSILETASQEHPYRQILALYVQAKLDQVADIEDRLENLIDRQQARLEAVREIKEGMGLHSPKIEELATRKMRAENPELASDWDAMQEAGRRHQLQLRKQDGKQFQALKRTGRSQILGFSDRLT